MTPAEVLREVTASGLRGRGGGGYPTGLKWSTVAKMPATQKYVICNADEGDPGAFMDRAVLESDPHRVLEGMAIAAYAVGANKGYVYVRAEYPLAVERLADRDPQGEALGLPGQQDRRDAVRFEVEIRLGAGAFVCGEETALMASIEGLRGQPRPAAALPRRVRAVGLSDADQQRRDLRQHRADRPQRRRLVRRRSAPRSPRAPRSSRWPARSRTPA